MLDLLTHPVACLVYFAALGLGLHKLLGDPTGSIGFIGRGILYAFGCLAIATAATLCGSYQIAGVSLAGPILLVPGSLVLIVLLGGFFVATVTDRYRPVSMGTAGAIATVLFLLLWRMYAI